jgi:hypothetical protein
MSTVNRSSVNDNLLIYIDPANPKSYIGSGINVIDLSRSKTFNMSLLNSTLVNNYNGGVFTLDGVDDTIESDISMINKIVENMTWDLWFRRTQDMNIFNMVFSCGSTPYLSFRGTLAGVNANKFLFSYFTRIGGVFTQRTLYSTNTYSNDIWYNVVCTLSYNLTTQVTESKIYINGVLDNTLTNNGSVDNIPQPNAVQRLRLGNYPDSQPYPFKGDIGSFKIYNKLLSADEVLNNYNITKSRFGL